jgi:hypothetical protein
VSAARAATTLALLAALATAGCGGQAARASTGTIPASLLAGMRPIGASERFHPPVTGSPTDCTIGIGQLRAHIELFAANRVFLIASGVGRGGSCDGDVVTLDPTGTVYFRPGATLFDLFVSWGQTLADDQLGSFRGRVREYVNGRHVRFAAPLINGAEIVLEVGPYVPPHTRYTFPATRP